MKKVFRAYRKFICKTKGARGLANRQKFDYLTFVKQSSVWGENDFIFSIFSCLNREGGRDTEVVPLVPAVLDYSGQCHMWFSTFFSSRRRESRTIGITGRPMLHKCFMIHDAFCLEFPKKPFQRSEPEKSR